MRSANFVPTSIFGNHLALDIIEKLCHYASCVFLVFLGHKDVLYSASCPVGNLNRYREPLSVVCIF